MTLNRGIKMYARFLLPLAAGAALLAALPTSAQGQYPPTEPVLTVSPATIVAGDSVVVTGSGHAPGEIINHVVSTTPIAAPRFEQDGAEQSEPIVLRPVAKGTCAYGTCTLAASQPDEIVTADGEGAHSTTITLTEVGQATITATGQESGRSASAVVTVLAPGADLPETGSPLWRLVQVGAAAAGVGVLLLLGSLGWRRRRARGNA